MTRQSDRFSITRRYEIDSGHRVPDHASKCSNVHGHRYVIEATVTGSLSAHGEENGMVMDFGFIKQEMGDVLDIFDHGLILFNRDRIVRTLNATPGTDIIHDWGRIVNCEHNGKVLLVPCVPTAENLARLWFEAIAPKVTARSNSRAELTQLRVTETPNCWSVYPLAA